MKVGYPNIPPGIYKIAVGNFNRSTSGAQAITGLGFVPRIVIFFAVGIGTANLAFSNGNDNGVQHQCSMSRPANPDMYYDYTKSIHVIKDGTNYINGYISSMDADGFTITWALTGAITVYVTYLAMR